jgi:hypothetical protein
MWNLVLVHLETVLVLVQDKCMVCAKCTIGLEIIFGHSRWYSFVTRLNWKLISVRLETMLVSIQDRCTVKPKVL